VIAVPSGTRVWLAAGVTDLRRGMFGLAALVQTALSDNPYSGHVFVFRGRRGDLLKLLWWSGDGLCLFAKRLERGKFVWPLATSGTVSLSAAQPTSVAHFSAFARRTRRLGIRRQLLTRSPQSTWAAASISAIQLTQPDWPGNHSWQ